MGEGKTNDKSKKIKVGPSRTDRLEISQWLILGRGQAERCAQWANLATEPVCSDGKEE